MQTPQYQQTQTLWLLWLLLPVSLIAIVLTAWFQDWSAAQSSVGLSVLILGVIPVFLGRFTVEVGQGVVEWRFGYLGRQLRLGSDQPDRLAAFIAARL